MQLLRDNLTLWTSDNQVRARTNFSCERSKPVFSPPQGEADESQEAGDN